MSLKLRGFQNISIVIALVCSLLPLVSAPAQAVAPCYTIVAGVVTDGSACSGAITIEGPTSIGILAFGNNRNITSVTIGDSVTSIGSDAFGNTGITNVTLGNSLTNIGDYAFNGASFNSITIPSSVTNIGDYAFSNNYQLTSITFLGNAPSVSTLGAGSFASIGSSPKAYIRSAATGFPANGQVWNGLTIAVMDPPAPVIVIPTYRIMYLANTNDVVTLPFVPDAYLSGTTIQLSSQVPARTGYTFKNWNDKSDGSGKSYAPSDSYTFKDADQNLYAQWKVNSYTLTLNSNGGQVIIGDAIRKDYLTTIEVSALPTNLVRTGFTWLGWNENAEGSGKNFALGEKYTFSAADTTLYARWKINSYQITYIGNGNKYGRVPQIKTQEFDTTVIVAAPSSVFTRRGYTFAGWNTEKDGSGNTFKVGDSFKLGASDITLFANWIPKQYKVTYYLPGGKTFSDYFSAGGVIKNPSANPVRTGYTFKGWAATARSNSIITFPYQPEVLRPIALFAVWEK